MGSEHLPERSINIPFTRIKRSRKKRSESRPRSQNNATKLLDSWIRPGLGGESRVELYLILDDVEIRFEVPRTNACRFILNVFAACLEVFNVFGVFLRFPISYRARYS